MIKVIKDIQVYSPENLGRKDVVIISDKIEGIYDNIDIPTNFLSIEVIDGKGKMLFPGFIDNHVHILGGGGEGSFKTRTPEIQISTLLKAGITTVVGCLGTDGVTRSTKELIAKARGLEEEGITAYCFTGSYEIPVKTVTATIQEDIILIDKIIGVGEVALSDSRSFQPSCQEFINTVAKARIGGLLSGKAGIVNIHLGRGTKRLEYLFKLMNDTEIPISQVLPTHINLNRELFEEGERYAKQGGFIDLTTSSDLDNMAPGEIRASEALSILIKRGVDINNITFSSDGNGSLPTFDEAGNLSKVGICSVFSLYEEVKNSVREFNIPINEAIRVITSNAAKRLKLNNKGSIESGKDADLVIVDEKNLDINTVLAKGQIAVRDGKVIIKGTFE